MYINYGYAIYIMKHEKKNHNEYRQCAVSDLCRIFSKSVILVCYCVLKAFSDSALLINQKPPILPGLG